MDDKFVACAVAGEAEYLITVDQDLLALGSVGDLMIVRPEQNLL
jgi:predicted nucleic acid-binding protein